jgi:hypothetical protein
MSIEPEHGYYLRSSSKRALDKDKSVSFAEEPVVADRPSKIKRKGSRSSKKRDSGTGSVDLERFYRIPSDLNSGGRALEALVRPYPMFTSGRPISLSFNIKTSEFVFVFEQVGNDKTEVYIPHFQYPQDENVLYLCDGGSVEVDYLNQRCYFSSDLNGVKTLVIRNTKGKEVGGVHNLTPGQVRRYQGKREYLCQIV